MLASMNGGPDRALRMAPMRRQPRASRARGLGRDELVRLLDVAEQRIESLRRSERLQQALYEIADLAGASLEMQEMLRRIHVIVGSLMYADNCYIVLYDDQRRRCASCTSSTSATPTSPIPPRFRTEEEMPNSLTFALLRHRPGDARAVGA
jgi:hypothetical protein